MAIAAIAAAAGRAAFAARQGSGIEAGQLTLQLPPAAGRANQIFAIFPHVAQDLRHFAAVSASEFINRHCFLPPYRCICRLGRQIYLRFWGAISFNRDIPESQRH
jgi:hypothetical protein